MVLISKQKRINVADLFKMILVIVEFGSTTGGTYVSKEIVLANHFRFFLVIQANH